MSACPKRRRECQHFTQCIMRSAIPLLPCAQGSLDLAQQDAHPPQENCLVAIDEADDARYDNGAQRIERHVFEHRRQQQQRRAHQPRSEHTSQCCKAERGACISDRWQRLRVAVVLEQTQGYETIDRR